MSYGLGSMPYSSAMGAMPMCGRVEEVDALIEIAKKCDIVADSDLFWKIMDRVYINPLSDSVSHVLETIKPYLEKFATKIDEVKNNKNVEKSETEEN